MNFKEVQNYLSDEVLLSSGEGRAHVFSIQAIGFDVWRCILQFLNFFSRDSFSESRQIFPGRLQPWPALNQLSLHRSRVSSLRNCLQSLQWSGNFFLGFSLFLFSEQQAFLSFDPLDFIFHCLVTAAQGFGIGRCFSSWISTLQHGVRDPSCEQGFFGKVILIILTARFAFCSHFSVSLMFFFGIRSSRFWRARASGICCFACLFCPSRSESICAAFFLGLLPCPGNYSNKPGQR
ncbi:MAG: hypothetical protein Ct9H90mP8_2480 [Pseudomonadota bacterium]|nr:MAG: hypothetical protein Ct9H90mP8_2480 [Pseudomonadota bacterium]